MVITLLLIILVLALALLLALYLIPVTLDAVGHCKRECVSATVTVAWGIFGARARATGGEGVLEFLIAGRPVMTRDLAEVAGPPREEEEEKPSLPVKEYINAATDLWPHIRKIIAVTYRSLYLEMLRGDVTLGLDNPADTGMIYGYCTALRYALWPAEAIDLVMTPVFDRRIFEGSLTLRMQVRRPLLIIVAVARALLQKPVRQRLRQVSGRGAPVA